MTTHVPPIAPDVAALLAGAAHPLDASIRRLRAAILAADPRIAEGIKWNAPSYHVGGSHFATFHLRSTTSVQLVFHLGAKSRPDARVRAEVPDPDGLLVWKSPDRATLTVADDSAAERAAAALPTITRAWIAHL